MLAATAAKLLASLDLDTSKFEAGARRVGGALGGMESKFSRIGGIAKQGVTTAVGNIAKLGVVATGAIAVAIRSGIQSLAELERAEQQTAAVIKSTGGAAGVTAEQVRQYAEDLERVTTADDKAIQSGENLLLTFTNIGSNAFPQATKAMVDMAIALAGGDVEAANFSQSALQIGKALNDPVRGMTALRRSGVSFTEQQEEQIKKMVESGDVMGAQKVILQELEKEFGEAGKAAGEGFGGDLRRMDDAFEDTRMALATGFLPVIRKVADALTTKLADPKVQDQIKDFGDTLAGAFDNLLQIGGKLPWEQIGASLKIAGAGAKTILDAFSGLPPWIQTAVLTGWGLNKLSGGALSKIGIELLAGKGGLFSRGGSPAAPMYTKEVGLGGGGGGGVVVPGAKGGIGTLGKLFLVGEAIGLIAAVNEVASQVAGAAHEQATGIHQTLTESLAGPNSVQDLQTKLAGINQGIDNIQNLGNIPAAIFHDTLVELETMREEVTAEIAALNKDQHKNLQPLPKNISKEQEAKFNRLRERTEANRIAIVSLERTTDRKAEQVRAAAQATRDRVESNRIAVQSGTDRVVSAINSNRPIVNVSVVASSYQTTTVVRSGGTVKRSTGQSVRRDLPVTD